MYRKNRDILIENILRASFGDSSFETFEALGLMVTKEGAYVFYTLPPLTIIVAKKNRKVANEVLFRP